jgi:hydroxyethylthiazole kinase-like uncharacterized protein yjeF
MSAPIDPPRLPPPLASTAHKGEAGRVLAIVGSETMPGAAMLVARACQRAGAGLVTVGCVDAAGLHLVPIAAPEAVLLDLSEVFEREGRRRLSAAPVFDAREPQAVLIGPGLGDDGRTRLVLHEALATVRVPLLLDADALNALDGEPERVAGRSGAVCVLTPHPGEARRLLGRPVGGGEGEREAAALELARRANAIVCLKGRGTVVAEPDGSTWVCGTGNEGMATAGAGDVLAGILAAFLARSGDGGKYGAAEAARAAVHAHGWAGDRAAERVGRRALIASDLIEALPGVLGELEGR